MVAHHTLIKSTEPPTSIWTSADLAPRVQHLKCLKKFSCLKRAIDQLQAAGQQTFCPGATTLVDNLHLVAKLHSQKPNSRKTKIYTVIH